MMDYNKLAYSLRKGIPTKLRGKIWIYLANAKKVALEHDIEIFNKLLAFKDEEADNIIKKDIERTILITSDKNAMIKKVTSFDKENLFNVLKAYASYDNEVRYCQGTNFIVAMLLANIPSKRYAFWTFVNIMNVNKWRDIFILNTPKLLRMLDILKKSIKIQLPLLYKHFVKEDFLNEFGAVFTHFFVSMFSYNVPVEYGFRVLDLFFILEEKAIFDCIIKLLSLKMEKLMTMCLEEMFQYIRGDLVKECINEYGIEASLPDLTIGQKMRY